MQKYAKHVYIFKELLTSDEIDKILGKHNNDYQINFNKKSYRKCDKKVFMDKEISEKIFDKLKPYLEELTVMEGKKRWVPFSCTDRIKLIKYKPGDSFNWHVDASSMVDKIYKITFSITIYLNTVPKKNNGSTMFTKKSGISSIQPTKGDAMLLNTLYGPEHCGEELKNGEKYILRLDLLARMD